MSFGWLWSTALLLILTFLVIYPVAMLLLGALTNTNPVVDGFGIYDLSLKNFITVLGNPNVHFALANSLIKWAGIDFRFDVYTMGGLIAIFGIYYAPYVYMFTASALRNMDPALEEAAEVSGASALRILLTVTFPLIAPAIISGMLLSFVVMLGIYGIPAVLGAPSDIPVLTTYIFKLTNWSPPLYSTAASVAIIL